MQANVAIICSGFSGRDFGVYKVTDANIEEWWLSVSDDQVHAHVDFMHHAAKTADVCEA